MPKIRLSAMIAAACLLGSVAQANAQFPLTFSSNDNGFFTPFNSGNANTVRYGDSVWIDCFANGSFTLSQIDLGLATFNSQTAGTTDIILTITEGDPSGLVFGSGQSLYQITIPGVVLPEAPVEGQPTLFTLSVPLPDVRTLGGCNNVGYSIRLTNFNFAGSFGFQCSTATAQTLGFFTNNASFFNGSNWSLFAFGPNPVTQIAQFTMTLWGAPFTPPASCSPADIANTDGETTLTGGGPDNTIDNGDFTAFFSAFFLADTDPARLVSDIANTDGETTVEGGGADGVVDNGDFTAFFAYFFAGCPV